MQEPVTSVADLPWRSESNGWGPVERDLSNGEKAAGDGQTITIGGRVFASGVGTHAPSVVTLDLGEACTAFAADVGLDDETGEQGSVRFQVWGDGVRLADSGVVRGSQPSRPIYADVTGVEVLELRVSGGGDGIDFDHADWGDARVSCDA
jgi:alpha-galactosidase